MGTEKILLGNVKGKDGKSYSYDAMTDEERNDLAMRAVGFMRDCVNICFVSATVPASDVGVDGDICVVSG